MQTIPLHPYATKNNSISIKLFLLAVLFLLIAVVPTAVAVWKDGYSIALVGTGLWLLVLGLLAIYCYRLALKIPGGFQELRLEEERLVCVSQDGEQAIPRVDIAMVMFDKVIANFVGFEIILTQDLNVIQLAVSTSQGDLHPVFDQLCIWLNTEEVSPNPDRKLPRMIEPGLVRG